MKKIIYSMSMAVAILFTACGTEDKGTSTEVADANRNEDVNPNHLNDYERPGTAAFSTAAIENGGFTNNTGDRGGLALENESAVDLVFDYYTNNDPVQYYNFTATERMGGMTSDNNGTNTGMNNNMSGSDNAGNNNGDKSGDNSLYKNNKSTPTNVMPQTTTATTEPGSSSDSGNKNKKGKKEKERLTPYNDKQ